MKDEKSGRRSNKTPQLMRLLNGTGGPVNPILDETFKEDIIRARENPRPMKPLPQNDGTAEINITSELISEWLPVAMKRFNCCTCDRCSAEAAVAAFDTINPVIVRIRNDSDLKRARHLKEEKTQSVLMSLVSICVKRKAMPKHS
ncbi:MAG: hypothetical protein ACI4KF_06585 [Huintestinicola sp.]